ncbi:two-component sensor histidine kinase [Litorimonas taeanensis]|uniref:histidine kinase n=1 Tax=Litorimonas taeanensis TaxID=568099 RepID=A0A420WEE9_9PROT|nr:two-component sensor histidine kinase [Litorimonas taeanensis]
MAIALFPILLFALFMATRLQNNLYIIVALVVWLIGYLSIWASIERLVFSHLRVIQRTSRLFSKGDMDARIGNLERAPVRIAALSNTFDTMAENISERELRLLENLKEKETLLREIHHRVKNNLQIIISLLNIQERKLSDHDMIEAIHDTRSRINAIALVHRGLYEGEDLSVIDMQDFLSRLISELVISFDMANLGIEVKLSLEKLEFTPDAAVPVALFIVEAISNAIKHAQFEGGTITVSNTKTEGEITISVLDSGTFVDKKIVQSTGIKLMKGFARQLSGKTTIGPTQNGFLAEISFPIQEAIGS